MAKAMTDEIREASSGDYLTADDFLNHKVKLRLTAVELQKDKVQNNKGEPMDRVVFYFVNNKREEKEIGDLAFGSLVRQMNAVDPDIGDVLELEAFFVGSAKYPNWKVEIVQKIGKDIPPKKIENDTGEVEKEKLPPKTEGAVNKNSDEDEIRIEDIPF